jgi:hypothetical protein
LVLLAGRVRPVSRTKVGPEVTVVAGPNLLAAPRPAD